MFTFKIFEIPDGKSQNSIQIQPDSLDLGDVTLKDGKVEIDFDKNLVSFVLSSILKQP